MLSHHVVLLGPHSSTHAESPCCLVRSTFMFKRNLNHEVAACFSSTLVPTYRSVWCHNPEDHNMSNFIVFIKEKRFLQFVLVVKVL